MLQAHRFRLEDQRVHGPRIAHDRLEAHMRQDVLFGIDARGDLDEFQSVCGALKYAALGHIKYRLPGLGRVGAAEGDLLDPVDELRRSAFAPDTEVAIHDLDLEAACRERTCEKQFLGVLRDIDESPGACEPAPEAADIDVSVRVRLRHAEAGEVETAALVKVELLILLVHSAGIEPT